MKKMEQAFFKKEVRGWGKSRGIYAESTWQKQLEHDNEQLRINLGGAEEAARMLYADKQKLTSALTEKIDECNDYVAICEELQAENERLKIVEQSSLENQKATEIYKHEYERLKEQYESTPEPRSNKQIVDD